MKIVYESRMATRADDYIETFVHFTGYARIFQANEGVRVQGKVRKRYLGSLIHEIKQKHSNIVNLEVDEVEEEDLEALRQKIREIHRAAG